MEDVVFTKKEMKDVFDKISFDFSETRKYPWPEVVEFINKINEKETSLDLGCGNGRHIKELAKKTKYIYGLDFSKKMLDQAKKELMLSKNISETSPDIGLVQGDASNLPFERGIFDYVICIATLHHIPSKNGRFNCLNEMHRVMKKESEALLSVWSIKHKRFRGKREEIRKNDFDVSIKWNSEEGKEERYYHIFTKENLVNVLKETKFKSFDINLSSGNYYIHLRKQRN